MYISRPSLVVTLLATTVAGAATHGYDGGKDGDTYDYIVVGSGPGGAPVASHLSRNGYSVLLLEAGDDQRRNPNTTIASHYFRAMENDKIKWDFFVRYNTDDAVHFANELFTWRRSDGSYFVGPDGPADDPGAERLGIYYPRAGTLGGCSMHNAGASVIPQDSYWDSIAALTGDSSWGHEKMRQYFLQLENNTYLPQGTPGHSIDGWLQLSTPVPEHIMSRLNRSAQLSLVETIAESFGHGTTQRDLLERFRTDVNSLDSNRDQQQGMFTFPWHHTPLANRTNANLLLDMALAENSPLTIQLESLVTKILFDTYKTTTPEATGVEYLKGKSLYRADPRAPKSSAPNTPLKAYARKEVILSAGVFNTPQLLKLSGIGPSSELLSHSIPLLLDLPGVGARLQDDYEVSIGAHASVNLTLPAPLNTTFPPCTPGLLTDPCLPLWQSGLGPYSIPPNPPYTIHLRSSVSNTDRDLVMWNQSPTILRGFYPGMSTDRRDPPTTYSFTMAYTQSGLSHYKSSGSPGGGTVLLRSADPLDVPIISFNAFNDDGDDDLQALYEGVQFGRSVFAKLHDSPVGPFEEVLPCVGTIRPPSSGGSSLAEDIYTDTCSEEETKAFIRRSVSSHHASSTAAIGADGDPYAVLDGRFRVRGVRGLRVVDGSALPFVPSPFPIIGQFMASLKAAGVILEDAEAEGELPAIHILV